MSVSLSNGDLNPGVDLLTGKTDSHVDQLSSLEPVKIHRAVISNWQALVAEATRSGFLPKIVSGFRSFDSQLAIWNAKARGERELLDKNAEKIDIINLSARDAVLAILRWSALPGASRHHWGTDFDVIDAAALRHGVKVRLVPEEFSSDGPFGPLHAWLDVNMGSYGFYRPYSSDLGGVSPERWHLSYAPLSSRFLSLLTEDVVIDAIVDQQIAYREVLLQMMPEIYERFIINVVNLTTSA